MKDALGKLYYYDSTRVNLGLFQHDVNVLWDLAPHDLAIVDYLIGSARKRRRDGRKASERLDGCGVPDGVLPAIT